MSTTKSKADSQKEQNQYLTLNQVTKFLQTNWFKILEQSEQNPRYQTKVLYVLAFVNMIFCFFIMGLPFIFATPNFLCQSTSSCMEPAACETTYTFDSNSFQSITYDYHWVCEKRTMFGYWVWSLFLGIFIGFFFYINFISQFSRKTTILFFVGLSGISFILAGISESQNLLFMFLLLGGFGFMQFSLTINTYLKEIISITKHIIFNYQLVNESFQQFAFMTISFIWALGQIAINYISYFINNWRIILIFAIGLPLLLCLILLNKLIKESPYYLISQQNFIDARRAITYIIRCNKIEIKGKLLLEGEPNYRLNEEDSQAQQDQSDKILLNQIKRENYTILDLLRPLYQRLSVILLSLWIYQQLSYYASVYSLGFYGKDVHTNYLAIGLAEILACIIGFSACGLKISKYKWILFILIIITMLSQLFMYYRPVPQECFTSEIKCREEKLVVIAATVNKFTICLYGVILKLYTSKSYPYLLSSSASNFCPLGGCIVGLFLPFVVAACSKTLYNPLGTIGWYGIGASLLTFFLDSLSSENESQEFSVQIEEMKQFGQNQLAVEKDPKQVRLIASENEQY